MASRWSGFWTKFFKIVDDETVGIFQAIVYGFMFAHAIYGLFISHSQAPITVQDSMSHDYVTVWYTLEGFGTFLCLLGKRLMGSKRARAAMTMQLTGDATVLVSLLAYISATYDTEPWGSGMYGSFPLGSSIAFCVGLLLVRDVRRYWTPIDREV